jgi:hypothetical protein
MMILTVGVRSGRMMFPDTKAASERIFLRCIRKTSTSIAGTSENVVDCPDKAIGESEVLVIRGFFE